MYLVKIHSHMTRSVIIYTYDTLCNHIYILAEGPGVVRGKKIEKIIIFKKSIFSCR